MKKVNMVYIFFPLIFCFEGCNSIPSNIPKDIVKIPEGNGIIYGEIRLGGRGARNRWILDVYDKENRRLFQQKGSMSNSPMLSSNAFRVMVPAGPVRIEVTLVMKFGKIVFDPTGTLVKETYIYPGPFKFTSEINVPSNSAINIGQILFVTKTSGKRDIVNNFGLKAFNAMDWMIKEKIDGNYLTKLFYHTISDSEISAIMGENVREPRLILMNMALHRDLYYKFYNESKDMCQYQQSNILSFMPQWAISEF